MPKESAKPQQKKSRWLTREQGKRILCLTLAAIMIISLTAVAVTSLGTPSIVVGG